MRCYICGKAIIFKRTLKTLFKFKPTFRCDSCKRRYQIFPFMQVIPKMGGMFYLYSLFTDDNDLNWLAFNDEVAKWFNTIIKKAKIGDYVFWLDKIDISTLEALDNLGNDIYILTKGILIL